MSWLPVAGVNDIKPGDYQQVDAGFMYVLICNVNGEYFAVEDRCTHDDASLAGGCLAGDNIVCPRHGATFCVRDGAVTAPPAYEPLQTFPVRVNGNNIEVEIEA
jgi:3-phenylpropionate/trans-cinnamate dioxygenase ferredoxin component